MMHTRTGIPTQCCDHNVDAETYISTSDPAFNIAQVTAGGGVSVLAIENAASCPVQHVFENWVEEQVVITYMFCN